ncbi:MAG: hypothetical protein WC655_27350 [Candidatus Hydrogenedentales bacterium]|jgi:hypothetical protein
MQELLTLNEAAKLLPNHPHSSALWRWGRKGLKAKNGETIRLPLLRSGGTLLVERAALLDFMRTLAEADQAHFQTPEVTLSPIAQVRSSALRDAAIASAEARLGRWGL